MAMDNDQVHQHRFIEPDPRPSKKSTGLLGAIKFLRYDLPLPNYNQNNPESL